MALRPVFLAFLSIAALSGCASQVVYGPGAPEPPPPAPVCYAPPPPSLYIAFPPPPFFSLFIGGYYSHGHGGWHGNNGYHHH